MEDYQIGSMDPVKMDFENESIWFTQTHIAEIKELLALRDAVKHYKEPIDNLSAESTPQSTPA